MNAREDGRMGHRGKSSNHSSTASTSSGSTSVDSSLLTQSNRGTEDGSLDGSESSNEELGKLAKQAMVYRNSGTEVICSDTIQCVQRYLRKIYQQVKFFSDNKHDFKEPCFITMEGRKKQSVVICEFLLKNIKNDNSISVENKVIFWKTYQKQIKEDVNKMRMADTNGFSRKFKKVCLNLYIFYFVFLCYI